MIASAVEMFFVRYLAMILECLLHPNGPRASADNRPHTEYGIRDIIVGKFGAVHTRGLGKVDLWAHEEFRARSGFMH